IFLTGENGFGKTTLLQALTIGLFGNRDGKFLLTDSDAGSKVAVIVYSNGKTIKNEP
ncbi:MAG: AAA family ATPase, partial [bacterium]|nr:AAA family ATPase [bacterium]